MKKPSQPLTIAITGGGTAGHLTPLSSIVREIRHQAIGSRVVYIGDRRERFSQALDEKLFDQVFRVSVGKFRRYPFTLKTLFLNLRDSFRLAIGLLQAIKVVGRVAPDVVFSKGSFVAVPAILAARLRGIPIVTHDSDTIPGLANRLAGKWAAVRTTGMPSELYLRQRGGKTHYVGVPIDEHYQTRVTDALLSKYASLNNLPTEGIILLVAGGSLGADALNKTLPSIAGRLFDALPDLFIVHIAGVKAEEATRRAYRTALGAKLDKRVKILGFSDRFYQLVELANLVITRAGATAIAEMAASRKACIVVPSPILAAGHQLENAKWLSGKGAVELIDNSAPQDQWLKIIVNLASDETRRRQLADNLAKLAKKNAATELAKLIVAAAAKKG